MSVKIPNVQALEFNSLSREEVFAFPHDVFNLVFQDGELVTTKQRTIWSWFLWRVHRQYPLTPLLVSHHIGNGPINPNKHVDILSVIRNDCTKVYNDGSRYADMIGLNIVIHETFNDMYNTFTVELEEYVDGAHSLDVLEVLKHPVVQQANNVILTTPNINADQIEVQHKIIAEVLKTDESLVRNSVAIAYRNELVKQEQLLQCISARGFMPEVDGTIFKKPMLQSYATGIRELSTYGCESRMASIAAFAQQSTMRQFQYQNRSYQLLDSDIRNIHYNDCGTKEYSTIFVDTMKKLKAFTGKYIMDDNGIWSVIDVNDQSLLNKPLMIRLLVNCKYPDRHGVCAKCFGELATSVISTDDFGQFVAAYVQQSVSQGALSTKHFSANSKDSPYELDEKAKTYFSISQLNSTNIMVNPVVVKNDGYIIFLPDEVANVNNLHSPEDLTDITINRFSKLTHIQVELTDKNGVKTAETVSVENNTKSSSLSVSALTYMVTRGWTVDEYGNYRVSMRDWDLNEPFIQVPRKKTDMVLANRKFDNFLKGVKPKSGISNGSGASITSYKDFASALMTLQELATEGNDIKVSHMETLMYGTLAADPANDDYRLPDPLNRTSGVFTTYRAKIEKGNMATCLAYERQGNVLMKPESFVNKLRSPSGFDYFVLGGEQLNKK